MSRNILFVCEGETEVCLIYKILKKEFKLVSNKDIEYNGTLILKDLHHNITEFFTDYNNKIYVSNLKGEDKLNTYIEELSNSREIEDIDKIIFLMDADFVKGAEAGYIRTKKAIEKAKEELLEVNSKIDITEFILPDNENDGMSETLILNSIKCQNIVNYIREEVIEKVKEMDESEIKNEEKTAFMMVAGTQNPLKGYAHHFILDCYKKIDKENKKFSKFIEFLKIELKIEN